MENNSSETDFEGAENSGLRVINRSFSLGEYGESWSKLERYLFIEIYNTIKDFYLSVSDANVITFSEESILLSLPIESLDQTFFKRNQLTRDLMNASERLSKKQINIKTLDEESGQWSFSFISMFPELTYNPKIDRTKMEVRVPAKVFNEMVPIESYCMLELKLLAKFNSGNTIRLYEIFMSLAFKHTFEISFTTLRKQLGLHLTNRYPQWKHFNLYVLKPAVLEINKHEEIQVSYTKRRGAEDINFTVVLTKKGRGKSIRLLSLDAKIVDRELNLIQAKYLETVIKNCQKKNKSSNVKELKSWIISDLMGLQNKQGEEFDFKRSMSAISKQIKNKKYTEPYVHKHVADETEITFSDEVYSAIKELERKNKYEVILEKYSKEILKAHHCAYLLDQAR
jgi:hypothetical protein